MSLAVNIGGPLSEGTLDLVLAVLTGVFILRPVSDLVLSSLTRVAIGVGFIALAAFACDTSLSMTGAGLDGLGDALELVVLKTHTGQMMQLALLALLTLAATELAFIARDPGPARGGMFMVGLVMLAFSRAASGHAANAGLWSAAVAVHFIHVASAAAWTGVVLLCALALSSRVTRPEATLATVVRASSVSSVAFALAIMTGVLNVERTLGAATDVADSRYVALLVLKVTLVAIALALGVRNRWHGLAALRARPESPAPGFARLVRIEAVVLVMTLLAAATLAATEPPQ